MTIEQAFLKARAAGYSIMPVMGMEYEEEVYRDPSEWIYYDAACYNVSEMLLNPNFWRCLGKACGWTELYKEHSWLGYWHSFIDHLAEGKSLADFFKQL